MRYYDNVLSYDNLTLLNSIFKKNEHFVTLSKIGADFAHRFKYAKEERLLKWTNKQEEGSNIYISKYRTDRIVDTIILDFDNKKKRIAYKDVKSCMKHLKKHDLSCMVVDSTNKGFHLYIRTTPYSFKARSKSLDFKEGFKLQNVNLDKVHLNKLFVYFHLNLIGAFDKTYDSLDRQNLNASLGGIIRLPFSVHPKTNQRVEVKFNNFKDFQQPTDFQFNSYKLAIEMIKEDIFKETIKRKEYAKGKIKGGRDIIADNDLRDIMPSLFGGTVKSYSNYIYMQCFDHPDSNPSLAVEKERYKCKACGSRGNIFTLIKRGYLEYDEV